MNTAYLQLFVDAAADMKPEPEALQVEIFCHRLGLNGSVPQLSDPELVPVESPRSSVDIDSGLSAMPASLLKSTLPMPAPSPDCTLQREIGFDL